MLPFALLGLCLWCSTTNQNGRHFRAISDNQTELTTGLQVIEQTKHSNYANLVRIIVCSHCLHLKNVFSCHFKTSDPLCH
jgi:hypothetical protein